jgi:predicted AAA+ superfamily ATPase
MNIPRYLSITDDLKKGKTLIIFGPHWVGKTTLLNNFIITTKERMVVYRGDELSAQHAFEVAQTVHF